MYLNLLIGQFFGQLINSLNVISLSMTPAVCSEGWFSGTCTSSVTGNSGHLEGSTSPSLGH